MCLLIAMWFLSGVVLMYVHFPALTPDERLRSLPALDPTTLRHTPDALLARSTPRSLTLTTVAGRPAWIAQSVDGSWLRQYADSGKPLGAIDIPLAKKAASQFMAPAGQETVPVESVDLIEMDQWTVSGSLHSHRPLFEVRINDTRGTVLYVSSQTGQVVRDTTRSERVWNWLGANLHWIYPLALRRHPEIWNWVVVVLSSIGLLSIITGTIAGVLRLRPKRLYRGRDWTPYGGVMKWHHVLGLICSLFLGTFMLSGLLSMNPLGVFTSPVDYGSLALHYQGAAPERLESRYLEVVRQNLRNDPDVKEIRWYWRQSLPSAVLVRGAHDYQMLTLRDGQTGKGLDRQVVHSATNAMRTVAPDARLVDVERLEEYDSYYYSHAGRWRPLPILRLRFNDQDRSWLHVDARTGDLLGHLTSYDRTQRWWYHGLHSLDFKVLIGNRPLWDIVMLALNILGFSMAVTGIVIGWRRLRPRRRRRVFSGEDGVRQRSVQPDAESRLKTRAT